ncbi:MAG: GTPase HflX [Cyclobacteriaceae bacterium]|nr:MAG: GTPase HflX [Cyclobacteriaceae bacterium]
MKKLVHTAPKKEKAILVALINHHQSRMQVKEYLDELEFLAATLGVQVKHRFTQKLDKPDIRTFVGKGKLEDIKAVVKAEQIDKVIFDDDLSPSQLRNLEKTLKCQIYDRSLLILDIFLKRAQTSRAKTQVELARFQYLLPRLTRMWTHLERQRGGTGTRGGAGEKEIETDRRTIRNQITVLKKKLEKIEKQQATQRKSRQNMVRVALVGYTNVGKSTLMRLLTKADVLAEDKLFATVDATVRKMVVHSVPFLISDTVGFIRKLPHHLIESFKSTLDEIREADLLLHVIDISHPSFEEQIEIVNKTLLEICGEQKPTVLVYNKIDRINGVFQERFDLEPPVDQKQLKASFMNEESDVVFVSAHKKENIDELREIIYDKVAKKHYSMYPNYLN